ncbi:hypothetical protein, partial [Xanthomonas sp. MUS 060]|uniref:hypothetical protein n=1 Tax=Xanthomonas sp. MUS 060 TaxID=1588031 RepID=UPI0005F2F8F6
MGILINELSVLYRAFARGEGSRSAGTVADPVRRLCKLAAAVVDGRCVGAATDPLAPLPIQYADYASWQRQWLTGDVLEQQARDWRKTLSDAPVLLELPTDRPRPPQQDHAGAM